MRILLDTHALIWWYAGIELDDTTIAQIADPENLVLVSAVSTWEMRIKERIGKLSFPTEMFDLLSEDSFEQLPISWEDSWTAGTLPNRHRDPFDRMLIAQAQNHKLTLFSRDRAFSEYDGFQLQTV